MKLPDKAANWFVLHTSWLDPLLLRLMLFVMPWRNQWEGRCLTWSLAKHVDGHQIVLNFIGVDGNPRTLTLTGDALELGVVLPKLEDSLFKERDGI